MKAKLFIKEHFQTRLLYASLYSKLKSIGLVLLFFGSTIFIAQAQNGNNISVFDSVIDRFGHKYGYEEIMTPANNSRATQINCASTSYFDVWFEAGSGFEIMNDPAHTARREVLCAVLEDLSNFLPMPPNSTGRVRLQVRALNNGLAEASPYWIVPAFADQYYESGIADNQMQKTIISGRDAYQSVSLSPLVNNSAGGVSGNGFYHGYVAVNFGNNFHTALGSLRTNNNVYDLYEELLHEISHALGFASVINYCGGSTVLPGANGSSFYYTRYDRALRESNGTAFIQQNNSFGSTATPMYGYFRMYNPAGSSLCSPNSTAASPNCAASATFLNIAKVYSPTSFDFGSSVSHFEDACLTPPQNNTFFLMSEQAPSGTFIPNKRSFKNQEREVFMQLGYRVATTFGNASRLNYTTYSGSAFTGINVIGFNDGVTATGQFIFQTTPGTAVNITNILANDYNATSFVGLEAIIGTNGNQSQVGTVLNVANGSNSTTITYTPPVGSGGRLHLLRYVPKNAAGEFGNITYIYVWVNNQPGVNQCAPVCATDLLPNGGFENGVNCCTHPQNTDCWEEAIVGNVANNNTARLTRSCTSVSANPNIATCSIPYAYIIPQTGVGYTVETWDVAQGINTTGTTNNNAMLHLHGNGGGAQSNVTFSTGKYCQMPAPIVSGQTYTLSFWAFVNEAPTSSNIGTPRLIWYFTNTPATVLSKIDTRTSLFGSQYPSSIGSTNIPYGFIELNQNRGSRTWQHYTIAVTPDVATFINNNNFTTSYFNIATDCYANDGFNDYNGGFEVLIDDISLRPATGNNTQVFNIPNNQFCTAAGFADLGQFINPAFIPNSSFSGQYVSFNSTTGKWEFKPVNPVYGNQYIIQYYYTDAAGCSRTETVQITYRGFSASVNGATVQCGSTATLTATTTGLPTAIPRTYQWSNGATTSSISVTTPGTYSVTVSASGCSATASAVVNAGTANISITMPIPPSYCGTGSVTISPNYNSSTTITSYKWANTANSTVTIGTNSTLSVSASGTYSVTATNASGCSATAAITIANNGFNVSLPPTATSCGAAVSIPATLSNGATTATYQWYQGTTLVSTTTQPSYSTATAGSYTVKVTRNGCTATSNACVVTIGNMPTPAITTQSGCIDGGTKLIATPTGTNYSYQWSTNTSNPSGNTAYAYIYSGMSSNVFTVTVTDNNTGCTAIGTTTYTTTEKCCSGPEPTDPPLASGKWGVNVGNKSLGANQNTNLSTVLANFNAYYGTSLTWNDIGIINVYGRLIIDVPVTLNNVFIKSFPMASIIVKNNQTLTLNNSILRACNYMWDGIVVEPGATLIMNNCKIEEARKAVYAMSGANVTLTNNEFNNNYIGFGTNGTTTTTFAGANIFRTTAANLKMPYDTRTVGYAGMEIGGNMAVTLTIPNCQFDKLEFGIIGTSTRLAVNGCTFSNINRQGNTPQYSGTAILVRDMRMASLRNTPLAATLMSNNTFTTCYQAGLFDDMSATVSGNVGTNLVNGFRAVRVSNNRAFSFTQNDLTLNAAISYSSAIPLTTVANAQNPTATNWSNGSSVCYLKFAILVQGLPMANSINITQNTLRLPVFYPQNSSLCVGNGPAEGIRVEHINANTSGNITIENNSIKNGYVGTRLVNISPANTTINFNVLNNNHYFDQGNSTASGSAFVLDNSANVNLKCNEVLGTTTVLRLGFQLNASANYLLEANSVNNTKIGMQFNGNCISVNNIKVNRFQNTNTAIELRNNASIGTQIGTTTAHPSNMFINTTEDIHSYNSTFPFFAFKGLPDYLTASSKLIQTVNGVNTNMTPINSTALIVLPSTIGCNWTFSGFRLAQEQEDAAEIKELLDEGVTGDFADSKEYLLQRELIAKILSDTSLLTNDTAMAAFYATYASLNVGQYEVLEKIMREEQAKMAEINAQYENDELLKAQKIAEEVQAKMAEINALVPSNQIEQNEKTVHEIYLKTVAQNILSYTEAQLTALYAIAQQCPFSGGMAVYQARTMLGLGGDQLAYDDQTNCSLGFYKKGEEEDEVANPEMIKGVAVLSVFPNPADDQITIYHNIADGKTVEINVINTLGQTVHTQLVNWSEFSSTIDVSRWATGLYDILFKINGKVTDTKKIIVE